MGDKTKIDWCDASWNPVTGCLHGCEYCYARGIAERFGMLYAPELGEPGMEGAKKYDSTEGMNTMLELVKPFEKYGRKQPYPMGFLPTFHPYRLDIPKRLRCRATASVPVSDQKPSKIYKTADQVYAAQYVVRLVTDRAV